MLLAVYVSLVFVGVRFPLSSILFPNARRSSPAFFPGIKFWFVKFRLACCDVPIELQAFHRSRECNKSTGRIPMNAMSNSDVG
jgi:hypothetical protein